MKRIGRAVGLKGKSRKSGAEAPSRSVTDDENSTAEDRPTRAELPPLDVGGSSHSAGPSTPGTLMSSSAGSAALHEASALSPDGGGAYRQLQMRSRAVAKTLQIEIAREERRTDQLGKKLVEVRKDAREKLQALRQAAAAYKEQTVALKAQLDERGSPSPGGASASASEPPSRQARAERAALNKVVLLEVAREEKRTAQLTAKLIELREMLRTSRAQVAALKKAAGQPGSPVPSSPGGADDEEAARLRDEVSALKKTVATLQAGSPGGVVGGAVGGAVDPPRRRGSGLREWPPRADGDGAGAAAADGGDSSFEVNRLRQEVVSLKAKLSQAESSVRSPEMDSLRRENSALKTKQAKGERERAHLQATLTEMRERAESGGSAAALAGLVMQLEADVDDAVSASDRASPEPFGAVRRRASSIVAELVALQEAGMMEGPPSPAKAAALGFAPTVDEGATAAGDGGVLAGAAPAAAPSAADETGGIPRPEGVASGGGGMVAMKRLKAELRERQNELDVLRKDPRLQVGYGHHSTIVELNATIAALTEQLNTTRAQLRLADPAAAAKEAGAEARRESAAARMEEAAAQRRPMMRGGRRRRRARTPTARGRRARRQRTRRRRSARAPTVSRPSSSKCSSSWRCSNCCVGRRRSAPKPPPPARPRRAPPRGRRRRRRRRRRWRRVNIRWRRRLRRVTGRRRRRLRRWRRRRRRMASASAS